MIGTCIIIFLDYFACHVFRIGLVGVIAAPFVMIGSYVLSNGF